MGSERLWAIRARHIWTLDPERPAAECLAVRGDRIAAVGSVEEVRARIGAAGEWIDLRPAVVTPGLTDSHIHLLEWAGVRRVPDLTGLESIEEVLERVRETCRSPSAGDWVELRGWTPSLRDEAGLSRLDAASQGRAIALIAHDLHSAWLNSEALRRLGITSDREDPPGGAIERDEAGRPTGVVLESALAWWYGARPKPDREERRTALLEAQAALHAQGLTGVHSVEGPESFGALQDLERAGELRLRVLQHIPLAQLDAAINSGIASGFGGDWLRVGGIKIFTDGALGSRTAWMLEPYRDTGGRGIRRVDPAAFRDDVHRAARAGLAATVHAIGDAAVRLTLDVLESPGAKGPGVPHRIEHLQCVHDRDLPRVARAGVVASMQPSHLLTDIPHADRAWGEPRSRGAYAFRSLLDHGTVLAFGSDAPVEPPDPREGFYAALVRRDRDGRPTGGWHVEERISAQEVLRAYTLGPARAAGTADRRGRLRPGFDADLVAWDVDLIEADPEAVRTASAVLTVVAGEVVHRA